MVSESPVVPGVSSSESHATKVKVSASPRIPMMTRFFRSGIDSMLTPALSCESERSETDEIADETSYPLSDASGPRHNQQDAARSAISTCSESGYRGSGGCRHADRGSRNH